jgi:energy-coupling factor transporter ATP-binding protein EcfA2
MSGFKLLAIRPLKNCNPQFSKNLQEGMIYKFYQDYTFYNEKEAEITIENKNLSSSVAKVEIPKNKIDLYSTSDLEINISVIIGENGSGKSTLIELLCILAFLIFKKYPATYSTTLARLKRERKELLDFCNTSIDRIRKSKSLNFKEFSHNHLRRFYETEEKIEYLTNKTNNGDEFSKLNCEFYFEKGKDLFKVQVLNGELFFFSYDGKHWIPKIFSTFHGLKSNFFYSVLLNYSIYSFRKSIQGKWIELLYHKNDAYKTPVVINPMKTNGNIEVNNEIHLQTQRIFNSILNSPKVLNREIAKIWFTLKDIDDEFNYVINKDKKTIFRIKKVNPADKSVFSLIINGNKKQLDEILFSDIEFLKESFSKKNDHLSTVEQAIFRYIIQKFTKYYLLHKYSKDNNLENIEINDFPKIFSEIIANHSFKEKKLNAAKWLLSFHELTSKFIINENKDLELIFDTYSDFIEFAKLHNFSESDPLSFLKMDFQFEDKSSLSDMSSGQLQLLNSINTITYHLRNLDSDVQSYKYVNIVLDEVELYLHPEFQRKYVFMILDGIKSVKLNKIKGINIMLLTHSPFILSDIISQNVLHLKDGSIVYNRSNTNSFGANIHQLLYDEFFLENGFIGEFAKLRINEVIDYLRYIIWSKKIDQIPRLLKLATNDTEKDDLLVQHEIFLLELRRIKNINNNLTIGKCKNIIDLVGEPVLQQSLLALYNEVLTLNKT